MADVEIIGESIPRPTYLACMSDDLLARADIELVVGGETLLCHYPIMALHSKVFDKILADTLPRPNSDTTTAAFSEGPPAKRQRCDGAAESPSHGVGPSESGRVRLEAPFRGKSLSAVQGMLEWMYSITKDVQHSEDLCLDLLALAHEYDIATLTDSLAGFLLPGIAPHLNKDGRGNSMYATLANQARSPSAAIIWFRHCERFNIDTYKAKCEEIIVRDFHALLETHHNDLALLDVSCLMRLAKLALDKVKASQQVEVQQLNARLATARNYQRW